MEALYKHWIHIGRLQHTLYHSFIHTHTHTIQSQHSVAMIVLSVAQVTAYKHTHQRSVTHLHTLSVIYTSLHEYINNLPHK